VTKILKPIQEEDAENSVIIAHYKHVFKRCHYDLKEMKIGPHSKSIYFRAPQLLDDILAEIIEIKS